MSRSAFMVHWEYTEVYREPMAESDLKELQKLWDFSHTSSEGDGHIHLPPVYIGDRGGWPKKEWDSEKRKGLHTNLGTVQEHIERKGRPPLYRKPLPRMLTLTMSLLHRSRGLVASLKRKNLPSLLPMIDLNRRYQRVLAQLQGKIEHSSGSCWKLYSKVSRPNR